MSGPEGKLGRGCDSFLGKLAKHSREGASLGEACHDWRYGAWPLGGGFSPDRGAWLVNPSLAGGF